MDAVKSLQLVACCLASFAWAAYGLSFSTGFQLDEDAMSHLHFAAED